MITQSIPKNLIPKSQAGWRARVGTAIAGTALGLLVLTAGVGGTAVPAAFAASARPSSLHLINSTSRKIHVRARDTVTGCIRTPRFTNSAPGWTLHPNSPGPAFNVEHANSAENLHVACTNPGGPATFNFTFSVERTNGGRWSFELPVNVGVQGVLNGLESGSKVYRVRTKCESGCKIDDIGFTNGYSNSLHTLVLAGNFDGQYFRYTLTVTSTD